MSSYSFKMATTEKTKDNKSWQGYKEKW
jgi:hypothetical protein